MESIFLEYSFWCMMVLFCKKWDSSALWERKWFLEVWKGCFLNRVSEEPHFQQNEKRCKNYPCADHNLLSTWHYWGTTYILCERETFLQMILNKIKMVEKECKRSIFSSRIISGIWWLNEIKRLALWSKIGLWCCKTIKLLKNSNPLK